MSGNTLSFTQVFHSAIIEEVLEKYPIVFWNIGKEKDLEELRFFQEHLEEASRNISLIPSGLEINFFTQLIELLKSSKQLKEAEKVAILFPQIAEKRYGQQSLIYGISLSKLGDFQSKEKGYFKQAIELYKKSLSIIELHEKSDKELILGTYGKYAAACAELQQFKESDRVYEKILNTKDISSDYRSLFLHELGVTLYLRQRPDDALKVFRQSLLAQEENKETTDLVRVGITEDYIGRCYREKGEYVQALEHFNKAIEIKSSILGSKHYDVGRSIRHKAMVYHAMRDIEKAEKFTLQSLDVALGSVGENHSHTASHYHELALITESKNDYKKTIYYAKKAVYACLTSFNPVSMDISQSLTILIRAWTEVDDFTEAEKVTKKIENFLASSNERKYPLPGNLGYCYYRLKQYGKAENYYKQAIKEEVGLTNKAILFNNLGKLYTETERYKDAQEYHSKALNIYLQELKSDHVLIAKSYYNHGELYLNQNMFKESQKYFSKALMINKKILPKTHPNLIKTQAKMAELERILSTAS